MFLLVSVRHVGAHPGEHQQGVSISAEISVFVELCVINNASSSEESISFQNWGLYWAEWLNSLGYKEYRFAVLQALHVLISLLELF